MKIKDLHYFTVKELLDYVEFYFNEEKNLLSKDKSKKGKTYQGGQGAVDFLRSF